MFKFDAGFRFPRLVLGVAICLALTACGGDGEKSPGNTTESAPPTPLPAPPPVPIVDPAPAPPPVPVEPSAPQAPAFAVSPFQSTAIASFSQPWSIVFLPDGRLLITERSGSGHLQLVTQAGVKTEVTASFPRNIGLLDVILDPDYASNHYVYLSLREIDPSAPRVGRNVADTTIDPEGVTVVRGTLDVSGSNHALTNVTIFFKATKIVTFAGPNGETGGRLLFSLDGKYLFIATGDRQEFGTCQELNNTICKILRLNKDGSVPSDNPFVSNPNAAPETWTYGSRNPYGLAFDLAGHLWNHENGPLGGDAFNLVTPGSNFGWPNVSNGRNYGATFDDIPDHTANDGYFSPAFTWTPVIAPSGMIFYSGTMFPDLYGNALITGLKSDGIVRVKVDGITAHEVERYSLGARMRAISQGPDGSLWVLEDGATARLPKLTPKV